MANIVKFPQTVYEKLVAMGKRRQSFDNDTDIYYGDFAASAWLDTEQAKEIAFRVASWVANNADFAEKGFMVSMPPGWHFRMIYGREPEGEEEAAFWAEMKGESEGFRTGFTRGLLHAVPLMLRNG